MEKPLYLPDKHVCSLSFSGKKPVWKPNIVFISPLQISPKSLLLRYIGDVVFCVNEFPFERFTHTWV